MINNGAWIEFLYSPNASMRPTNLAQAYLTKTDLSSANLQRATLSGAKLSDANFKNANLTDVVGLNQPLITSQPQQSISPNQHH